MIFEKCPRSVNLNIWNVREYGDDRFTSLVHVGFVRGDRLRTRQSLPSSLFNILGDWKRTSLPSGTASGLDSVLDILHDSGKCYFIVLCFDPPVHLVLRLGCGVEVLYYLPCVLACGGALRKELQQMPIATRATIFLPANNFSTGPFQLRLVLLGVLPLEFIFNATLFRLECFF